MPSSVHVGETKKKEQTNMKTDVVSVTVMHTQSLEPKHTVFCVQ